MIGFNFNIEFLGGVYDAGSSSWSRLFYQNVFRKYSKDITEKKLLLTSILVANNQTDNLKRGVTYFGQPVAPLSAYTIKMKGHDRPFLDKGVLFQSVAYRKVGQENLWSLSVWEVYIKQERAKIAERLYRGDPSKNLPARPFFGVGAYLLKKIDSTMER